MKNLLTQIKNEWRSNLFLLVELLLVFCCAVVYCGLDACHRTGLSRSDGIRYGALLQLIFFSTLTPKSALYNPDLTVENNIDALL